MPTTQPESFPQMVWNSICYLKVFALTLYYGLEYAVLRYIVRKRKDLSNEVILVTGSGRGIGRELCLELSKTGAKLVCWSRTAAPNEDLVQHIRKQGGTAYAYTVDVGDRLQVEKTAAQVKREVGDVTMIINNAGLMKVRHILDTTPREVEEMFQVNVLSNFWVIQQFLPAMIEKRTGHIVAINSASGILPAYSIAAYCSTKHAQHGFVEALRQELGHHPLKPDIKFTTAFPFYCSTDMLEHGIPNTRIPSLLPILTPSEVAQVIVDGIRREFEYVYVPRMIYWLAMFSWIVTPKAVNEHGDFFQLYIEPLTSANAKMASNSNNNQDQVRQKMK